jgi:hypothetical protein
VRFPRQVIALFAEATHWRNGYVPGTWTHNQLDEHRAWFGDRMLELVRRPRAVPEYATLAKHLRSHFEQWFAFVFDPRTGRTNWKAEQAIRPAVVNRKVWGGNRTATGAKAQGVLMRKLSIMMIMDDFLARRAVHDRHEHGHVASVGGEVLGAGRAAEWGAVPRGLTRPPAGVRATGRTTTNSTTFPAPPIR